MHFKYLLAFIACSCVPISLGRHHISTHRGCVSARDNLSIPLRLIIMLAACLVQQRDDEPCEINGKKKRK